MKKGLFALLCFLVLNAAYGQNYNEKYGVPIVVLMETDPWLTVIGSDVPTFALYEHGQIIYRKTTDNGYKYFQVTNDFETTQKIIEGFGITKELMEESESYIVSSKVTDQPINWMLLNFENLKEIAVYGDLRNDSTARRKTPECFLTVYDNILNFDDSEAKEWLPKQIEVLATAYPHSPETPLKWNKKWNDLKSPSTVKRSDVLYSIYIDKKYFPDLLRLLGNLKEKQAVEINGKKFTLSYRLPFPNLL